MRWRNYLDYKMRAAWEKPEDYPVQDAAHRPQSLPHKSTSDVKEELLEMAQVALDRLCESRKVLYLTQADIEKEVDSALCWLQLHNRDIKKQRSNAIRKLSRIYREPVISELTLLLSSTVYNILRRWIISQQEVNEILAKRMWTQRKVDQLLALEHTKMYPGFYDADWIE